LLTVSLIVYSSNYYANNDKSCLGKASFLKRIVSDLNSGDPVELILITMLSLLT